MGQEHNGHNLPRSFFRSVNMHLLYDPLHLVNHCSIMLLAQLAELGGRSDLTTSELERAGFAANRQSLILLNADFKRAAQ